MASRGAELRLGQGARIAVVGGGPSGVFFAHFAQKLAAELGLAVEIVIFEHKSFVRRGPAGCDMGAGIVSEAMARLLREEGFGLTESQIQRHIHGYRLHTREFSLSLRGPAGHREISAVFRGGGPRLSTYARGVSFDEFLLERVVEEAPGVVRVVAETVSAILPPGRPGEPSVLRFGRSRAPGTMEADLVVGAFGLNSPLLQQVGSLGFGYRPPPSVQACQTEVPLTPEAIRETLGDEVHAFLLGGDSIRFGVLTPKERHVTVSVIGRRSVALADLRDFLEDPAVRRVLPAGWRGADPTCFCFPRLSLGAARHPFADRLVIVGDAAVCRIYKNGFESAFHTARLAADTALRHGVSAGDFASGYYRRLRPLIRDNFYGQLLFDLNDLCSRSPALAEVRRRLAMGRPEDPAVRLFHKILWGMLTGSLPYRRMLLLALSPRLALAAAGALAAVGRDRLARSTTRARA